MLHLFFKKKNVITTEAIASLENAVILIIADYGRIPLAGIKLAILRKRLCNLDFDQRYTALKKRLGSTDLNNIICAAAVKTTAYYKSGEINGRHKIVSVRGNIMMLKHLNTNVP